MSQSFGRRAFRGLRRYHLAPRPTFALVSPWWLSVPRWGWTTPLPLASLVHPRMRSLLPMKVAPVSWRYARNHLNADSEVSQYNRHIHMAARMAASRSRTSSQTRLAISEWPDSLRQRSTLSLRPRNYSTRLLHSTIRSMAEVPATLHIPSRVSRRRRGGGRRPRRGAVVRTHIHNPDGSRQESRC
jgi:hypothetical protein